MMLHINNFPLAGMLIFNTAILSLEFPGQVDDLIAEGCRLLGVGANDATFKMLHARRARERTEVKHYLEARASNQTSKYCGIHSYYSPNLLKL